MARQKKKIKWIQPKSARHKECCAFICRTFANFRHLFSGVYSGCNNKSPLSKLCTQLNSTRLDSTRLDDFKCFSLWHCVHCSREKQYIIRYVGERETQCKQDEHNETALYSGEMCCKNVLGNLNLFMGWIAWHIWKRRYTCWGLTYFTRFKINLIVFIVGF